MMVFVRMVDLNHNALTWPPVSVAILIRAAPISGPAVSRLISGGALA
jgi:hypothetical protein